MLSIMTINVHYSPLLSMLSMLSMQKLKFVSDASAKDKTSNLDVPCVSRASFAVMEVYFGIGVFPENIDHKMIAKDIVDAGI